MHLSALYDGAMIDIAAAERLAQARSTRFSSARQAALALGISPDTYSQYENGIRGYARHAARFSNFYRVNLEWLVRGVGPMQSKMAAQSIPIAGLVGAGASVELISHTAGEDPPGEVTLPEPGNIAALIVRGESQWPRFLEGEIVLFDPRPANIKTLIGQYAVVQDHDGRTMIKILRNGTMAGTFRLESHNAPPEDNVLLLGAWRYLGTLSR